MPKLHCHKKNILKSEDGFVLVISMFILVILTLIGIAATRNTTFELMISGNDKVNKQTFYSADAATEVGIELVEENLSCPVGFTPSPSPGTGTTVIGGAEVFNPTFWQNETPPAATMANYPYDAPGKPDLTDGGYDVNCPPGNPSNSTLCNNVRDAAIPRRVDLGGGVWESQGNHTNLSIFGNTVLSTGSAIQLAQGYEGKGKGAAGGGAYIAYEIHAQHKGATNSEAVVRLDWNHLIGFEGECNY